MSCRIRATRSSLFGRLRISWIIERSFSTTLSGTGLNVWLRSHGTACSAARRPNTIVSRREFAPTRFAPCTLTHAASPAEYSPRTAVSPSTSVLMPPMM